MLPSLKILTFSTVVTKIKIKKTTVRIAVLFALLTCTCWWFLAWGVSHIYYIAEKRIFPFDKTQQS